MYKKMLNLILCLMVSVCISIKSASAAEIQIASVVLENDIMTVTGTISESTQKEVTILVCDGEEIVYIDQKTAETDGSYEFVFGMPDNAEDCTYTIMQGGSSVDVPAVMEYSYTKPLLTEEKCILSADATINLSLTQINIAGTVYAERGTAVDIELTNVTDNVTLLTKQVGWTDGEAMFDITISDIHSTKQYKADAVVYNTATGSEIGRLNLANINTALATIEVNGNASVSDGYYITGNMKSVNTSLIDKTITFSSQKTFDFTIPNAVISTYNFGVKCYEKEAVIKDNVTVTREYNNCIKDDYIEVFVRGLGMLNVEDKLFSIEYSTEQAELADGCLFTLTEEKNAGEILGTDIEIVNIQKGRIDYKVKNSFLSAPLNLTLNGVRLKALVEGNIKVYCTVEEIDNE